MAGIAQLVEQRTENPRVTSSNLVLGIGLINFDKFLVFKLNVSLVKKVQSSFIPLSFFVHVVDPSVQKKCIRLYT